MGDAVKGLVEVDIKMGGLGGTSNFRCDVEEVVHCAEIWESPVLAVINKRVVFDEGLEG